MVDREGKTSKRTRPWEQPVIVSGLTPEEVAGKMKELGEEAVPLRETAPAHGPSMAGTQLQRSKTTRITRTGIK